MKETFVITTMADPDRPALCFRVEVPEGAVDLTTTKLLASGAGQAFELTEEQIRSLGSAYKPSKADRPNTTITRISVDGRMTVHTYSLTLERLRAFLFAMDEIRTYDGKQGRPEKAVLQLTTSKERRLAKRQVTY